MVAPLRHRQTKEAETDMFDLQPPRHISTLPKTEWLPTPLMSASTGSGQAVVIRRCHAVLAARSSLLGPDLHRPDHTSFCSARSLDHLVGSNEQRGWHTQSKRSGRLLV